MRKYKGEGILILPRVSCCCTTCTSLVLASAASCSSTLSGSHLQEILAPSSCWTFTDTSARGPAFRTVQASSACRLPGRQWRQYLCRPWKPWSHGCFRPRAIPRAVVRISVLVCSPALRWPGAEWPSFSFLPRLPPPPRQSHAVRLPPAP